MFEGLLCYRDAIEMLLNNIKAYFALVVMNLLFFALLLLVPSGVFIALQEPALGVQAPIAAGMSATIIFLICNFMMLTISANAVKFDAGNSSFRFRDLLQCGISKWKMCMMSIGFNFIVFTAYFFLVAVLKTLADNTVLIPFLSFILLAEIIISVYFYVLVWETNSTGDFKPAVYAAFSKIRKYPKLTYGFLPMCIIFGLVTAYLIYAFLNGMWNIVTVMQRPELAIDMQQSVLHVLFSSFLLILLNTINLCAKGIFLRAIERKEQEVKRFID